MNRSSASSVRGGALRLVAAAILLLSGCQASAPTEPPAAGAKERFVIRLRWVQGHDGEDWAQARMGLLWSLSNLGALPPPDLSRLFRNEAPEPAGRRFDLDLGEAGFPPSARPALARALEPLLACDEMKRLGAVDVGRFLMATLYSPWRYYEITGACPTFDDWKRSHLAPSPVDYAVTVSQLTKTERFVTFNRAPRDTASMAFVAAEGSGSIAEGTFRPLEHETVDLMPNRQQRFAVYGEDGRLQASGTPRFSPAGQPGKCMWCHEMRVQLGTMDNRAVPPLPGPAEFQKMMLAIQETIDAEREGLATSLDFRTYHVHTWGERLVEEFLSPSPARLAREWGIPVDEVREIVRQRELPTHVHREYPDLGPLVTRSDADRVFAERLGEPFRPLEVLPSSRELDPVDLAADGELTLPRLVRCLK